MPRVMIKSSGWRGFSCMTLSLGGMDAKANAAKVSMIRFTHNICVTVRGSSVPKKAPMSTMSKATRLMVSWNRIKRWILRYSDRPHITAVPMLWKELSNKVMSEASLATEVPEPIDSPTWAW